MKSQYLNKGRKVKGVKGKGIEKKRGKLTKNVVNKLGKICTF
jgi:hypothetical protein